MHGETVARINAGQDIHAIMREVQLPAALRVGQGYGKVSWAVRTIFESYTGWFQRRATSELYAAAPEAALADLVELAGAKVVLDRARGRLAAGDPLRALALAEAAAAAEPASRDAAQLLVEVHEALLARGRRRRTSGRAAGCTIRSRAGARSRRVEASAPSTLSSSLSWPTININAPATT